MVIDMKTLNELTLDLDQAYLTTDGSEVVAVFLSGRVKPPESDIVTKHFEKDIADKLVSSYLVRMKKYHGVNYQFLGYVKKG